jgi:hypothetical protein
MESPHLRVLLPNMRLKVQSRDRLVANLAKVRHLLDGFDIGPSCPSRIHERAEQGDEPRDKDERQRVRRSVNDEHEDERGKPEKERG